MVSISICGEAPEITHEWYGCRGLLIQTDLSTYCLLVPAHVIVAVHIVSVNNKTSVQSVVKFVAILIS